MRVRLSDLAAMTPADRDRTLGELVARARRPLDELTPEERAEAERALHDAYADARREA